MTKPELILHVGIHKTGTTSIQHFFHRNFDVLLQNGVLYPKSLRKLGTGVTHFAHHDLAWHFGFSGNKTRLAKTDSIAKRLNGEFLRTNARKIFISSEALEYFSSISSLENFRDEFIDFDVKILIYIRRQDKLLQSVFKQRVKTGMTVGFNKFYKKANFNFDEKISEWETVFGIENIKIKIFDDPEVKSNLIGNLLNDLGIENTKAFKKEEFLSKNESFSNEHTAFIRQLNAFSNAERRGEVFKFFKQLYDEKKFEFDDKSFFTKKQLMQFYKKNADSNESLRLRYFPEREFLFDWDIKEDLKNLKTFKNTKYPDQVLDAFYFALNLSSSQTKTQPENKEEDDI